MTMTELEDVKEKAIKIVREQVNKKPLGVTGVDKEEGKFKAKVEALERKAVPDTQNILGRYIVEFNSDNEVQGYERDLLRIKGDTSKELTEEEL